MIVVKKFFPWIDPAQGVDENSAAGFTDFAIRIAGMIDESRRVPVHRGIDHPFAVTDPEKIHSRIIQLVGNVRPQPPPAGVFNDALAFPEWFPGKNAAAMNP